MWCDMICGVLRCGGWCDVVWWGVVWCDVMWCDCVMWWCDVMWWWPVRITQNPDTRTARKWGQKYAQNTTFAEGQRQRSMLTGKSSHCSLVTPYGDGDMGQHWLRQWLVAVTLSEPMLTYYPLAFKPAYHFHERKIKDRICIGNGGTK